MNNYSSDEEKLISWFQENYKNILLGINKAPGFGSGNGPIRHF